MKRILILTFACAVSLGFGLPTAQSVDLTPRASASAPASQKTLTSVQVRRLVKRYYEGVRSLDPERYAAGFAEDGRLEDPVGTPPAEGRQAIEERYRPATLLFSEINMYPRDVFAPDFTNEAAVRWRATLRDRVTGAETDEFFGITYFKFNNDGLIRSARVFWNPADLAPTAQP